MNKYILLSASMVLLTSCITINDHENDIKIETVKSSPKEWKFSSTHENRYFYAKNPHIELATGKRAWLAAPGRLTGCDYGEEFEITAEATTERLIFSYDEIYTAGDYRLVLLYKLMKDGILTDRQEMKFSWFSLIGLDWHEARYLHRVLFNQEIREACPETWKKSFYTFAIKAHSNHLQRLFLPWLESSILSSQEKKWLIRLRGEVSWTLWLDQIERNLLAKIDPEMLKRSKMVEDNEANPASLFGFGVWPLPIPETEQESFAKAKPSQDPVACRVFGSWVSYYNKKPLSMRFW